MKIVFKLLLLAVACTTMVTSSQVVGQPHPQRALQLDSLTADAAVKTGEQILAQVNEIVDIPKKVDSGRLLDVAAKIVSGDASIAAPDAETKKVVDALTQVVGKLFPGQQLKDVLQRVLPLLPKSP